MNFIRKPSIDVYQGIVVDKDTKLEFKNEHTEQVVENLTLRTVAQIEGDGYVSTCHTTIFLEEGDVLLFEADGRGYIKPVESFVTVEEAISDLEVIKDMG